ncbi:Adaptive-response sensory-kinase SasA [Sinobacterium norvegicum]|uniref:histidine kinase n=1 Tax=Sinobacterium norvegicum TaxID=1641715 RepID=A0ABN8EKR1_9GAMM|nr:ATP-binding protein [Sinobacterium norvegicum]CAH0991977.1 Adaptive-response sensory-kinase SasA [Sinobacterium norvegicum]
MKLRQQLLLTSLLVLLLPLAATQFIRELELALQQGQQQSLNASLRTIAAAISDDELLLLNSHDVASQETLYFDRSDNNIILDGYDDDWQHPLNHSLSHPQQAEFSASYRTAIYNKNLFFYISVKSNQHQFYNPSVSPLNNGDRIVLITESGRRYVINSSTPGNVYARYLYRGKVREQHNIYGQWLDSDQGYNIEFTLPLALAGDKLSFLIVDGSSHLSLGNKTADTIYYPRQSLNNRLAVFNSHGVRLIVTNKQQWIVGHDGDYDTDNSGDSDAYWLIRKLYRSILSQLKQHNEDNLHTGKISSPENISALIGQPSSRWYNLATGNQKLLSTAVPIIHNGDVIGSLIGQQSSERFLSLTDGAFSKLLGYSTLAIAVLLFALIGFSGWLSWRIRTLSISAERLLDEDGSFQQGIEQRQLPNSHSRDEIGDLARSYQTLFNRLQEYTDYLRTLSSKLSHELRTPLAIIHSSLDNLETSEQGDVYRQRAKDGALRLSKIITAMSEASRVEDSIKQAEFETVNLAKLIEHVVLSYQDIYPQQRISSSTTSERKTADDSAVMVPELIVQMLDKLVDNAADFCPDGGVISIDYTLSSHARIITVTNEGPLLPQKLQHQLFDNMVSMRENKGDDGHLGLGLHIVKLIVEFHRGSIKGYNLDDQTGVCFDIRLPVDDEH